MSHRRDELEAAIDADPDDPRAYEVYADFLQEHGDPHTRHGAVIAALARSRLVRQLERLSLRDGQLGADVGVVLVHANAFAHLALDLSWNRIPYAAREALAGLRNVEARSQQPDYFYDDDDDDNDNGDNDENDENANNDGDELEEDGA